MDAATWLWPGGWGSPVGLAVFMAGLGFFFLGFGFFFFGLGRLNQSKLAVAEMELKERQQRSDQRAATS